VMGEGVNEHKHRIVIIDDNEGDVFLLREALRREGLDCEIVLANNGADGISILCAADAPADRPDCILLDLNLPKVSGNRVLQAVRERPGLAGIPVLVLGTPQSLDRLDTSRPDNSTFFFAKSSSLHEFLAIGAKIRSLLQKTAAAGQ
jgi:chemotaxis family two-component system response regulator Rcp1